ncbi:MAG: AAA family ATPase [Frankiaceae bacterium]|nr:AAA family ATPase [Frankiaceae bacterium]
MAGWTCAGCGADNPVGNAFCGQCGSQAPAVSTTAWSCRSCGASNPEASAFCGGCGTQRSQVRQEELRLVTALFADISGFTSLAETLDTEELHEVISPVVRGLTEVAERYGGFVEKYAGDALLVVFGAPVTHEDDAQRALLTALDMHAAMPVLLAALGPQAQHLEIHVGVNTGRVIARHTGSEQQSDYAVLGDSVILAQRLESVCPSGETYVGELTHELCGDTFAFEPLAPLTLKGKAAPVSAYRLVGRRTPHVAELRPMFGRVEERAVLAAALDDLGRGGGSVVTITGEPGSGKSRLVAALREDAEERTVTWLTARCLSYGASLPYWPFADLLRQVVGIDADDDSAVAIAKLAAALPADAMHGAQLLLSLAEDAGSPQAARRAVHEAVVQWLQSMVDNRPVVLVIEDLHWIDSASTDLLREVLVSVRPLVVVMTQRPDAGAPAFAMSLSRHDITLTELSAEAVAALAAEVLGKPPGPMLADLLVARTGGNPLFVEELTRTLAESDSLVDSSAGCELRPGGSLTDVPTTVEQVLATRVDALPPPAAGLLQVASVIGRTMPLALLEAVAGVEAMQELNALLTAGMLDRADDPRADAVSFHHALLQDVVHARLLRRRRRELHRQVADVGRELYGEGDETIGLVARHLFLAEAGQEAVDALLRAGRHAAALYANDEAAVHLSNAIEVLAGLPDADVPAALQLELAGVQEVRGAYDEALALYRAVRTSTGAVPAWRGELAVLRARGKYDEALALWTEAAQAGARGPELDLERGSTLLDAGGHAEDAIPIFEAALTSVVDEALAARLLGQLARAQIFSGREDEALHTARSAVERACLAGDLRQEAGALRMEGDVLRKLTRFDDAERVLSVALGRARRAGAVDEEAGLLINLGLVEVERGNPGAALAHYEKAIAGFERIGHASGIAVGYGNVAEVLLLLGRAEDCLTWCDRATDQAETIGHLGTLADAGRTRARALQTLGDLDAACLAALEAARVYERMNLIDERDACLRLAEAGVAGSG